MTHQCAAEATKTRKLGHALEMYEHEGQWFCAWHLPGFGDRMQRNCTHALYDPLISPHCPWCGLMVDLTRIFRSLNGA